MYRWGRDILLSMLSYVQAEKLAAAWVEIVSDGTYVLDLEHTLAKPYGWVFCYSSRDGEDLAGNAPVIVGRNGELHLTGTARPLEYYLAAYERSLVKPWWCFWNSEAVWVRWVKVGEG
jgi:hypothetical protein